MATNIRAISTPVSLEPRSVSVETPIIGNDTPIGTFLRHEFRPLVPREAMTMVEKIDREYQRKKRDPAQIDRLAHLIQHNEFPMARISVVECPWDTEWPIKIADGASTVEAVVKANRPVRASILYWRCDSRSQWPRYWASHGLDAKTRGWTDEVRQLVNSGVYSMVINVSPSEVNRFRNASEIYLRLIEGEAVPKVKVDRLELVERYPHAFDVFQKATRAAMDKRIMKRANSVATIILTCEAVRLEYESLVRQGIAGAKDVLGWPEEFWVQVVSGMFDVKHKEYPPYKLHQWLRAANYVPGDTGGDEPRTRKVSGVGNKEVISACVNCWNAWLDGRHLMAIRTTIKGDIPPCQGAGVTSTSRLLRGGKRSIFGPPRIVA
jgi:hypothetical protein